MERLRGNKAILLIWLAVCLLLLVSSLEAISSGIGLGPDDQLRQVQLRDWLSGQSWFDTIQYRIAMPDSQPMHWPRLIEIPLALAILALTPILGSSTAETVAMVVIPLLLLGAAIWLIYKITNEIFDEKIAVLAAALTATAVPVLIQLRPMRIDHHGWQVVLALFALWTLFWPNQKRSGIALGSGLALLLSISLEGLPLAAGFVALLAFQWVRDIGQSERFFWTLVSLLGGVTGLFLLTQGHFNTALIYCDAVSPIHIMAALAGSVLILPAAYRNPEAMGLRLATLLFGGVAAMAVVLMIEPRCVGGAFGTIDPLVRHYWLSNVAEGLPVWSQEWKSVVGLFGGSIFVGIATLCFLAWKKPSEVDGQKLFLIGYALAFSVIVALLVQRASATAAAFAVPLMAWAVHQWFVRARKNKNMIVRIFATAAVVFLIMPGPLLVAMHDRIKPDDPGVVPSSDKAEMSEVVCGSPASIEKLNALPRTDIVTPFNLGPRILLLTPHSVLATSHHRNDAAMADQIKIFATSPSEAEKLIRKRDVKYLAICPDEDEMGIYAKLHPDGLWAQIEDGKQPSWLQTVHLRDSGMQVWRVVQK